ncbi:3-keto-disaccharide hydrolase [Siphonobacter aquaeclarae]|uniref:3-keto-alpha-glucoside-1,2-lyase/3-keto-2-hydroxy-glucal hydratase domain-containing protein n=1 Tax=Siphonobacter aquaeclarae TaxID=563176 RepID=A0A1G9JWZ2_9BACT|nr:DUF1080 domain-containing protein [Siphonobacter aquaeclarae]MBO9637495.1 DUF1080 domain-containing protein [Siphonobacter aquaeclarae]SDL42180.1 protein of unknown function [Siphonobacter aquaeclarae]
MCKHTRLWLGILLLAAVAPAQAQSKKSKKDGFVSIFDGKTLKGWDGDPTYWKVEDGCITGEITPATLLKTNNFLIWTGGEPADFELKGEFKIAQTGNSGINYRSERLTDVPFALKGYQADIDGKNTYTGQNYEERKRTTLAYRGQITKIPQYTDTPENVRSHVKRNAWDGLTVVGSLGSSDSLKTLIKSEDWNTFHLVIRGNRLQHYINDVLMSDVTDEDTVNGAKKGYLGVQVHVGPPMKVQYRNLFIKQK